MNKQTKKKTDKTPAPELAGIPREDREIEVSLLKPSSMNFRQSFPEAEIKELAESIGRVGLLEPLLVRTGKDLKFEIIAGERRWRAAVAAGLKKVRCQIAELTDEQALEAMIHENLHRKDIAPLEEAHAFEFLHEKKKHSFEDIGLMVGKPAAFVQGRYLLSKLIKPAKKMLEDGSLPIGHAYEIAKFDPGIQPQVLEMAFPWGSSRPEVVATVVKLRQSIQRDLMLSLKKPLFDTRIVDLIKGVPPCAQCPKQTGANASLFAELETGKDVKCLDRECYSKKEVAFIRLQRSKAAKAANVPESAVRIVTDQWYTVAKTDERYKPDTILNLNQYKILGANDNCKRRLPAIRIDGREPGGTIYICAKADKCETHYKTSASTSTASGPTLEEKRARKEEIIDAYIAEKTRMRVFELIAPQFPSITGAEADILRMNVQLYKAQTDRTQSWLERIVREFYKAVGRKWPEDDYWPLKELETWEALDIEQVKHCQFILLYGDEGEIRDNYMISQKRVRDVAERFGINYRLIDAEERVAYATEKLKKHLPKYQMYLDQVQAGKKGAVIPRPYNEAYKPKD